MEFAYDNALKFIKQYFKDYTAYAQNPETTHRMHAYVAPDFQFTPFIAGNAKISGRDEFLRLMSSHPSSYETIIPKDVIIDEKRAVVCVLARTEVTERKAGKVVVKKHYLPRYQLDLDEKNTIKIKRLVFFEEILPPGALEVHEVFRHDL